MTIWGAMVDRLEREVYLSERGDVDAVPTQKPERQLVQQSQVI